MTCGWKVTEYIYSVTFRFEILVHHQKHAAESAVCDVTELLSCDWTGEDVTAGDRFIHDRDVDWLRQSDGDYWLLIWPWAVSAGVWPLTFLCSVIVAEVTQPSLGVGYELGRAVAMKKQILCLFRPSSGRRKDTSCLLPSFPSQRLFSQFRVLTTRTKMTFSFTSCSSNRLKLPKSKFITNWTLWKISNATAAPF